MFTTRHGTPIEPRNFTRSFGRRIRKAKVRRITVHGTRKSCGSLLAALHVHPQVAMQILRHSKTLDRAKAEGVSLVGLRTIPAVTGT